MPVGVLSLGAWTAYTYTAPTTTRYATYSEPVAAKEDDVSIATTSYPTKTTYDRDSTSLVTSTGVDDSGGLDTDFDAADDPTIVETDRALEERVRESTSGSSFERTLCEVAGEIAAVAERVPLSKRVPTSSSPTSSSGDSTTVERQLTSDEIRIIEQQAEAQAGGSAGDGSVTLLETTTTLGPDSGAEAAEDAEGGSSKKRRCFPWWLIAAGGAGLLFVATRG